MPAAQQRYFAGLIVLQGEERNQKIGCHFVAQAPLRSRVIGLALCADRLKDNLEHGVQCPRKKELNSRFASSLSYGFVTASTTYCPNNKPIDTKNNIGRIINSSYRQQKWLYLVAFPAGHGAVDWGSGALWLLAPAMAISMDLNPIQVGILFAARQIAAGIAQFPAGLIGDNLRMRGNFLLASIWWVSVAQLIASSSTNYWVVIGFLTLASSGAAAWHPVAMGTMVQWMPDRKGFVLAIHMLGGTIAEIAAPLLGGILLMFLDWDRVLQISTVPTLILGVIFLRLASRVMPPPSEYRIGLNIPGLARSLGKPGALAILLTIILQNMSLVAFMSMAPLYFQEIRGFSPAVTGLGFSLFLIGGAVASPFVGHLSDKVGRKTMAVWGLVGGGICGWFITLMPNDVTLFPLLIITGFLMLTVRSVIIAMALEKIEHRESTVLGLISSVGEGFAALGAVLGGIFGGLSLDFAIILAAVLSIIAGLAILPLNRNG